MWQRASLAPQKAITDNNVAMRARRKHETSRKTSPETKHRHPTWWHEMTSKTVTTSRTFSGSCEYGPERNLNRDRRGKRQEQAADVNHSKQVQCELRNPWQFGSNQLKHLSIS